MEDLLYEAIRWIADRSPISHWRRVYGGDINDTFYVRSAQGEYFVKYRKSIPPQFFSLEKLGLETIRATNTIAVPSCYGVKETETYGFLVMEWISGEKTKDTPQLLGEKVAQMHQTLGPAFGFEKDNYIGMIKQKNGWFSNWIDYLRNQRFLPQIRSAEQKGYLPLDVRKKAEILLENFDRWIPKDVAPSLLHGDLWGGNWIAGKNGIPYLIDPAVFYGHFEFELAFTQLFGGFPSAFYASYREIHPIPKEYEERKALYQLFYLLVHLNLFGKTYFQPVKQIIERYTG
ncbi:fructosamine kinase family protein [Fervidibacillus halotolerans]|uniref:Fructosamine kinase family protein n=1 Tax=Fervidibacillus halotolerans TaxID=2980027 RepID=A0A9E8M2Q8_9BACI|nr:fructosamine kinase family protein [Fervidibacillus halotolerans]WAA13344.1 fructosamine kinase family protein [Fervidibacillus halotolerans]